MFQLVTVMDIPIVVSSTRNYMKNQDMVGIAWIVLRTEMALTVKDVETITTLATILDVYPASVMKLVCFYFSNVSKKKKKLLLDYLIGLYNPLHCKKMFTILFLVTFFFLTDLKKIAFII